MDSNLKNRLLALVALVQPVHSICCCAVSPRGVLRASLVEDLREIGRQIELALPGETCLRVVGEYTIY